ncbi:MAG: hypothetical protein ACYSWU_17450 [Planctomycetota bacterium]|jgi:hypothetical protein
MARDKSSKRSRGCLGCGGCLLAAVLLIVLVPTITLVTWSSRSSRRVEAELARVRAAGEPTTASELDRFYPAGPAGREAARRWLIAMRPLEGKAFDKAAEGLPIVGTGGSEIPPPGEPWPDIEAVEKFLEQYEAPLRQLHAAAAAGGPARYPTDFSQGLLMSLDHVQSLREGARLLALEAHVRAHRGDAQGAARSIDAIFMLADSLKQEPIIISQLVRYAIDGIAMDLLQRQLPTADFSDEDLDRLQAHLRAVDYSQGLQRGMMGERVMGIMAINNPAGMGSSDSSGIPFWGLLRSANLSVYLKYMNRMVAATKRPLPQARREAEQIGSDVQSATGGSPFTSPGHIMTSLLVPAIDAFVDAAARMAASSRATDAVIAVERFRRTTGRLSENLDELVPELLPGMPIDPFHRQPLRYVVKDDEYVIYSVGRDGVDDGGQGNEQGEPDLVFPVQLRQPEP